MTETNDTVKLLPITRNNITVNTVKAVFSKLSPNKGKEFPNVEITAPVLTSLRPAIIAEDGTVTAGESTNVLTNIEHFLWVGLDGITKATNKVLRSIMGSLYVSCVEENTNKDTGEINWDGVWTDWQEAAPDFSAARVTLGDLDSDIEDKQALVAKLFESFEADAAGMPLTENDAAIMKQIKQLNVDIKALKTEYVDTENKYKAVAEKRKATKARKEAEAKAKAGSSAQLAVA